VLASAAPSLDKSCLAFCVRVSGLQQPNEGARTRTPNKSALRSLSQRQNGVWLKRRERGSERVGVARGGPPRGKQVLPSAAFDQSMDQCNAPRMVPLHNAGSALCARPCVEK